MYQSILDKLLKVEGTVAALAFLCAAVAILADVVGREVFGQGIWGAAKFAVFGTVTAGFLGIGLATHAGMHLRPQFADGWIPARFEPAMKRITPMVTAIIFFILGVLAYFYVRETFEYGQMAPVLDWPMWIIQLVMPYAFFSNGVRNLIYALQPDLLPGPAGIF